MNIRTIAFLGLIVCSNVSLIGMSRLGNRARLVARNVASRNLARLKTDNVHPKIVSKEVPTGDCGSITIFREDTCPTSFFVDYFNYDDSLKYMMITALYIRNRDQQYVSLMRHHTSAKLLDFVEDSLKEGIEICTKNGNVLEQITAICAMPERFDIKSKLITKTELAKRSELLLTDLKSVVLAASTKHDLSGRIIKDLYSDFDVDGFQFVLDPNAQRSYWNHMQRSEYGGAQYRRKLLYEHQQVVRSSL